MVVDMSSCMGKIPAGTKIDRDMKEYIESQARKLGVSEAEFLRRLLEFYRASGREEMECPSCDQTIVMDLRE